MKDSLIEIFGTYAHIIIFLHVISAIIWIGGMIAIRLAVHPNLQLIEDNRLKLGKTLDIMGKFFNIVIPFIITIIVTATIMAVGLGFRANAIDENSNVISESAMHLYNIVHIKEAIWLIMTINFIYIYIKRRRAKKLFDLGDLKGAKESVALIPNVLLPINIFLGIVALWLGITLRGF